MTVQPIGKIHSGENGFYIAIGPGYIPALEGLEGFSHIQVLWWFSNFDDETTRAVLQTPKPYQKAPEIMGIFATRSPIRPNPIALTAAKVLAVDYQKGIIQVDYLDGYDGTPVLDIKPYTPSQDRIEAPEVPEWCRHWPKSLETSGDFDWEGEFLF